MVLKQMKMMIHWKHPYQLSFQTTLKQMYMKDSHAEVAADNLNKTQLSNCLNTKLYEGFTASILKTQLSNSLATNDNEIFALGIIQQSAFK